MTADIAIIVMITAFPCMTRFTRFSKGALTKALERRYCLQAGYGVSNTVSEYASENRLDSLLVEISLITGASPTSPV